MSWLDRHATAIGAASALITALVAVGALIGVSVQLSEADRVAKEATAREAYRNHLALAVATPAFAAPTDACAILASDTGAAYQAFVDHLLYAAEQMLEVEDGWDMTFGDQLANHRIFICSHDGPKGETDKVANLLNRFRSEQCNSVIQCSSRP